MEFLPLEKCKSVNENITLNTDHFTGHAMAIPTRNQLASTTAWVLFELSAFIHVVYWNVYIFNRIETSFTLIDNGQVSRFNQTKLKMTGTLDD